MKANHNTSMHFASWRNHAQRVRVLVVRPVGVLAVSLVDSITRIADAKPAPSGQVQGVP